MMHHTQRVATHNGRVCFEAGRPMAESNPYPKSSQSHGSFIRGWLEAEARNLGGE